MLSAIEHGDSGQGRQCQHGDLTQGVQGAEIDNDDVDQIAAMCLRNTGGTEEVGQRLIKGDGDNTNRTTANISPNAVATTASRTRCPAGRGSGARNGMWPIITRRITTTGLQRRTG